MHLNSAGSWESIAFRQENRLCILALPLVFCEHAIFKFQFKK